MEKVKAFAEGSRSSLITRGVPPLPPSSRVPVTTWSAPAPASPVPAPPPTTPSIPTPARESIASSDPTTILDELVATVAGVRSAILASVDGFGLARSSSMSNEASHPAMLAAAIGLAHQLVAMGGGNRLRQLVVDHDGGLMLVWPIGEQRVLAVLSAATVEQRRVRSFVQARGRWLSGAAT